MRTLTAITAALSTAATLTVGALGVGTAGAQTTCTPVFSIGNTPTITYRWNRAGCSATTLKVIPFKWNPTSRTWVRSLPQGYGVGLTFQANPAPIYNPWYSSTPANLADRGGRTLLVTVRTERAGSTVAQVAAGGNAVTATEFIAKGQPDLYNGPQAIPHVNVIR